MADNYLITGYWGEPHVTAENDRGINAAMFGVGRFVLPVGEQFRAEYIGNNTIRMYDGKLMDNGAAAGIPAGEYVDLLIANAGQGKKRNDLIVFQYSQDASTLIESGTFVVIRGTETSGTASDPELTQEDLLSGNATFDQMALWRVSVSGTAIAEPEQIFKLYNKNFASSGQAAIKYSASTLGDFNTLINDLVNAMDAPSTNRCIISKSVWDDGDNIPSGDYFVEINKSWHGFATVIATDICTGGQIVLRRTLYESTWRDWEWENPRMTVGVEYRTTEQFDGKPVYIKRLSAGSMPSASATKRQGHGIENMAYIVDFGGCMTKDGAGAISLPYYFAAENWARLSVTNEDFVIVSGSNDVSAYNDVRVWVKYTKTTD